MEGQIDGIASQQSAILDALKGLGESFQTMKEQQSKLPMAEDPEKQLQRFRSSAAQEAAEGGAGSIAGRSRQVDLMNPRAGLTGFQPRDIVKLLPDSAIHKRIISDFERQHRENDSVEVPSEVYGVVRKFMYVKKHGGRKYRVQFEGIGEEGCLEGELELARSA